MRLPISMCIEDCYMTRSLLLMRCRLPVYRNRLNRRIALGGSWILAENTRVERMCYSQLRKSLTLKEKA